MRLSQWICLRSTSSLVSVCSYTGAATFSPGVRIHGTRGIKMVTDFEKTYYTELLKSKDEIIKSKDTVVEKMEAHLKSSLKSKDDIVDKMEAHLKTKDALLESARETIKAKNAEILLLQGRLSLRSVLEGFETKAEFMLGNMQGKKAPGGKNSSKREVLMREILTNDFAGITKHLPMGPDGLNEAETLRWIKAMQSLYDAASKGIHGYMGDEVVINTARLGADEVALAEAICEATPIPYRLTDAKVPEGMDGGAIMTGNL